MLHQKPTLERAAEAEWDSFENWWAHTGGTVTMSLYEQSLVITKNLRRGTKGNRPQVFVVTRVVTIPYNYQTPQPY